MPTREGRTDLALRTFRSYPTGGDEPGFVRVVDARPLQIPDAPGNNRLDSLTNILET